MTTKTEFPSQHREGLDHIYKVLSQKPNKTRKIVDASQMPAGRVGDILALGARAGVTAGDGNGHWTRADVKRTAFRDAIVRQWFLENTPFKASAPGQFFKGFLSNSQLYYTTQRLRKDTSLVITIERDGTRTPVWAVVKS